VVSVQHNFPPLASEDSTDIQRWLTALTGVYAPAETGLIHQAC
jgi:hypothetical protein